MKRNLLNLLVGAITISLALMLVFSGAVEAAGTPGVTDDSILLCAYQPMTGNESTYFRMGKGADAWYRHVNEAMGGVNGRKIIFRMRDDKYQPSLTRAIVKKFIEHDGCFAITNPLGSVPTSAVIDYLAEKKVPLIGAGTGAKKNVEHSSQYVFPLYLNYSLEGYALAKHAHEAFGGKRLAMIYHNEPSGKDDLAGAMRYVKEQGLEMVATQGFEMAEIDVSSQVVAAKNANPDVLVVFAAPEHLSKVLVERAKLGWNVPVVASFVGLAAKIFELAGKEAVEGTHIGTIFQLPDSPDPKVKEFKKVLKKYYPQEGPSPIHMWGYAGAQVVTEGLKRAGRDLTREKFIQALATIKGWKGSIIPEVNLDLAQGKRIIVSDLAWVIAKDGKFQMLLK